MTIPCDFVGAILAHEAKGEEQASAHLCKLRLRASPAYGLRGFALPVCGTLSPMAIYHLSVKTISRSDGRSSTAASAYRAGASITDERTGEVHDYTRRRGVEASELVLPVGAPEFDRSQLWNAAEASEKRKNSTVTREYEIGLPDELNQSERLALVREFAAELVKRHGVAVDFAIHTPGKEGDNRNHHAHVLTSTRRLGPAGFGEKSRELDAKETGSKEVEHWRERWASLANVALERAGQGARIDHRSLVAQRVEALALGDIPRADSLDRTPTRHLGPVPTVDLRQSVRKRREPVTDRARDHLAIEAENRERQTLLQKARALGDYVREHVSLGVDAFKKRYEAVTKGVEVFKARAEKYLEHQAEKTKQRDIAAQLQTRARSGPGAGLSR